MSMQSRRDFLAVMGVGAFSYSLGTNTLAHPKSSAQLTDTFPAQDAASVKEVVSAAHGRLEDVKRLVNARPALARASWDWGFGDWESALGAASHMGRRDIAQVLIDHGARPNLFTHVLMGHTETVKAIIMEQPGIQQIRGPHSITLMRHAQIAANNKDLTTQEKDEMEAIIAFLEQSGDANIAQTDLGISESDSKTYLGNYKFGDGEEEYFKVELNRRGNLYMSKAEEIGRTLGRVEEHGFAPFGAEAVRIRFSVTDGAATSLSIHDPEPLITAVRI